MRTVRWIGIAALLAAGSAQAQTGSLVSTLVSQLGVTETQASGGAGSILSYAKSNLSVEDFGKITKAVPETEGLVKAAPAADTGLGGGLGGTLGSVAGAASLTGSFQKLGLSSDMVMKFAPVVVNYVSGKGGSSVGGILSGALGGILGGGSEVAPPPPGTPTPAPAATKKTTTTTTKKKTTTTKKK